jgi:hypothetical protein
VDDLNLPNTESPEVMTQAVSLAIAAELWEQASRDVHPNDWEEALLGLYTRVYRAVYKAHQGG